MFVNAFSVHSAQFYLLYYFYYSPPSGAITLLTTNSVSLYKSLELFPTSCSLSVDGVMFHLYSLYYFVSAAVALQLTSCVRLLQRGRSGDDYRTDFSLVNIATNKKKNALPVHVSTLCHWCSVLN